MTSEIFRLQSGTFLPKCSKFHVDFSNPIKIAEKVFDFQGYSVPTSSRKIFQLRPEYMWSSINLRKHCPNISDLNKTDVSVPDISDNNGKLEENLGPARFSSVFEPLTR